MQKAHGYGLRAAVGLAELCAAFVCSPDVCLPLSIVRFCRFDEMPGGDDPGTKKSSKPLGGILGLLLRHLLEALLQRLCDVDAVSAAFAQLRKYDDVAEGMLLVLDGLVRPRLAPRAQGPGLWDKFRAARRELTVSGHSAAD